MRKDSWEEFKEYITFPITRVYINGKRIGDKTYTKEAVLAMIKASIALREAKVNALLQETVEES